MSPADTVECVRRARMGESAALESLYTYLRERLLHQIEGSIPRYVDAEDVIEDTILIVLGALKRLRREERLLHYASKVAQHLILKSRRRSLRCVPIVLDPCLPMEDPSYGNLEADELLQALSTALNDTEMELFRLLYVAGASSREICDKLGFTSGNFRKRKHRLHAKLRQAAFRFAEDSGRLVTPRRHIVTT